MGFFDFFKKKKQHSFLDSLPPAIRQAFDVLFPKGVADHARQLDELCQHYGNKYKRDDINSNLIFILLGYLVTRDSKMKDAVVAKVMRRLNNTMTKSDVEYLHDFALSNHPKLAPLIAVQSAADLFSKGGCDTDTIPGGSGFFGYSPNNPIPTKGVMGSYEYLEHLRDAKGNKISYKRLGTTSSSVSEMPIDVYEISSPVIQTPVKLCISAYHKRNSQLSPSEFVLVDSNDIVLSSGSTTFGVGQRCVANATPKPKFVAINYFGVISSKEITKFPQAIIEAENLNRRGFLASNKGDSEGAIALLKQAIAKGSVNAINSLFAVLHSAERYQEAYDFLLECANSEKWSAALFYNLAIINCGYDTRYLATPNFEKAMYFLKRSIEQLDDGMEEYRSSILDKAEKLYDELYKQLS